MMQDKIGIYTLLEKIKEEKHFSVFIGYHPARQELVKLKVFTSEKSRDPLFYDNLRKIYQLQERLAHPGLEKPIEVLVHRGYPVVVLPLEKGSYLDRLIQTRKIPLKKRLTVLKELGHVLLFLEKEGLIHGHVQPSSVFVLDSGTLKLENMGVHQLLEGSAEGGDVASFYQTARQVLQEPYQSFDEKEKSKKLLDAIAEQNNRIQDILRVIQEKGAFSFDPLPVSDKSRMDRREATPSFKTSTRFQKLPRRRTKQLLTCSGLLLVSLFLFAIAAIGLSKFIGPPLPDVKVPDLIGKSFAQAKEITALNGLKLTVKGYQFSRSLPRDSIISQQPEPEATVKKGRVISVVLSKGKETVVVPALTGSPIDQARLILDELGLKADVQWIENEDITRGTILAQTPESGRKLEKGEKIYLRVAKEPKETLVKVPDVVGQKLPEARKLIAEAELKIHTIKRRYSDKEKGTVVEQMPAPGTKLKKGEAVFLITSLGPAPEKPERNEPQSRIEKIHSAIVDIAIPEGEKKQPLEVVVSDAEGRHVFYKKQHQGGDSLSIPVKGKGNAKIEVYFGGKLVRVEKF